MSDSGSADVFDIKKIRRLVELMEQHGLSEMDLERGDQRVRLRRTPEDLISLPPPPAPAAPTAAPPAQPATATPAESQPASAVPTSQEDNLAVIKSPMVGTFYTSPNPDSPPFVKVGDHVGPSTTVCIVEAMKVFNEIPAEVSGKIVAVLVENGDPVDYGQALYKVDASA